MGGGAEKQLLLAAAELQKRDFECLIFWLQGSTPSFRSQQLMDRARANGARFFPPSPNTDFDWRQLLRVRACLRGKPDAVVWTWGYRADMAAILLRLSGCGNRLVGSLRSAHGERIHRYRWFWWLVGRTHSAFIGNSELNVRQVSAVAPRVGRRAAVIYNAVEARYFDTEPPTGGRPEVLRVMMLGNQTIYTKGYDVAVEVGSRIKSAGMPFEVHIGGSPRDSAELAEMVRRQNLAEVVRLHGTVDEPLQFLRGGHVFMMLSRYEGTPNALLEAMALGLPAICTPVGDVASFGRDTVHLRLVDGSGARAFQTLCELWENWDVAQRMGRAGRALCQARFGEDLAHATTASVLRQVHETGRYRATGEGGKK